MTESVQNSSSCSPCPQKTKGKLLLAAGTLVTIATIATTITLALYFRGNPHVVHFFHEVIPAAISKASAYIKPFLEPALAYLRLHPTLLPQAAAVTASLLTALPAIGLLVLIKKCTKRQAAS